MSFFPHVFLWKCVSPLFSTTYTVFSFIFPPLFFPRKSPKTPEKPSFRVSGKPFFRGLAPPRSHFFPFSLPFFPSFPSFFPLFPPFRGKLSLSRKEKMPWNKTFTGKFCVFRIFTPFPLLDLHSLSPKERQKVTNIIHPNTRRHYLLFRKKRNNLILILFGKSGESIHRRQKFRLNSHGVLLSESHFSHLPAFLFFLFFFPLSFEREEDKKGFFFSLFSLKPHYAFRFSLPKKTWAILRLYL